MLPAYDELPIRPDAPPGSSWGVWGDRDVLGCLHLLTPERVVRAASCIRTGEVFPLDLPIDLPDPPLFGRDRVRHEVRGEVDARSHDDVLHGYNTQSSTQWDGFRHIRHREHGFYGGVPDEEHGMHHWASRGIAGRAVLVDVDRWRAAEGRPLAHDEPDPITPDDVRGCIEAQGTPVEPGDVLLLRTGWVGWYRAQDEGRRRELVHGFAAPGLQPGTETARLLWDLHVAAVAADNPALEVWPLGGRDWTPDVFVHTALLPLLGIPIGELFDLDRLAEACAADRRYDAFLTSAPLHVPSGVASPPNALAIR